MGPFPLLGEPLAIDLVNTRINPPSGPEDALQGLNRIQRAAPAIRELSWDGHSVVARTDRLGPPGVRLAADLAEAAAELLTGPTITAIRQCQALDCVALFIASNPRRRWCTPAICGNRVRVARYYKRHKNN
jgi:predicted RNA-binding Zn ribbon-like protein